MRDKRGFPDVDDDGHISIESVNLLRYDDLRCWIRAVLSGEDPGAGGNRSEMPHGFLKRVYRYLDPRIRQCFEDALLSHLDDFAKHGESNWTLEAADELLLLTGSAFHGSPRQRAPVDHLRYIATNHRRFFSPTPPNLHLRAVQTLVTLHYRAEPDFWRNQYRTEEESYAIATLAGLALCGIAEAFDWLKERATENAPFTALMRRLPRFSEEYPREILCYIEDLLPLLPDLWSEELRKLALRLGLRVPAEPIVIHPQPSDNLTVSAKDPIPLDLSEVRYKGRYPRPRGAPHALARLFRYRDEVCRDPKGISAEDRQKYVEIAEKTVEAFDMDDTLAFDATIALDQIIFLGREDRIADALHEIATKN